MMRAISHMMRDGAGFAAISRPFLAYVTFKVLPAIFLRGYRGARFSPSASQQNHILIA